MCAILAVLNLLKFLLELVAVIFSVADFCFCGMQMVMAQVDLHTHTHTHTHSFNGPFSGTTQLSWYQKGKTNLDFTEARDREWQWQWHWLGRMQVCTLLQTDNHASTPPLIFLQAGCPSCRLTNSIKALLIYFMIILMS